MKFFIDRWRLYKKHQYDLEPLTPNTPIECIYDIINTLDKKDTIQRLQEFKRWPVSKTLVNGKSFQEKIKEGNFSPGTFGAEYKKWLVDDNFMDLVLIALGSQKTKSKLLDAYIKNSVITHDLVHFLNGYGTDSIGEVNVLSFDLAREWRASWSTIVGFLGWFSLKRHGLRAFIVYVRWCTEAYLRGRRAVDFMYTDWEQMFDLPLDEVKRKVGIYDKPKLWNDSKLERYKSVLQNQG